MASRRPRGWRRLIARAVEIDATAFVESASPETMAMRSYRRCATSGAAYGIGKLEVMMLTEHWRWRALAAPTSSASSP
jgi:hypothetical protein